MSSSSSSSSSASSDDEGINMNGDPSQQGERRGRAPLSVAKERQIYLRTGKDRGVDDEDKENIAPNGFTKGKPQGHSHHEEEHHRKTPLQKHCSFFDRDNDGVIWPIDTFVGFFQLGFGLLFSILAMLVIHGAFSYPTVEGYLPDPFFRVYLDRIHRAKHGSDSGSYDNDGEFVSDKFEEFFEKYSSLYEKDGLTIWDTMRGIVGQRCVFDVFGWGAAMFEWIPTWVMVWPKDGVLRKEDVRGVYDGSIFWKVAKARGVDLGREGVDM